MRFELSTMLLVAVVFGACVSARSEIAPRTLPAPQVAEKTDAAQETIVLAGGCFWGVQGVFQHVEGVRSAVSGYAGGGAETARYYTVAGGATGHAEAVRVTFDPRKIGYGKILQIFFSVAHDPTEIDRQGPDEGTQYRSAIFPANEQQARVAKAYIAQLDAAHVYSALIATRIEPSKTFFSAEAEHQDFLARHPTHAYIVYNDLPKLAALKRLFPEVYRDAPTLVSPDQPVR
jgi:peptide-methionine (S)-S-oxide reductase